MGKVCLIGKNGQNEREREQNKRCFKARVHQRRRRD